MRMCRSRQPRVAGASAARPAGCVRGRLGMRKVVVSVDGSEESGAAVRWCATVLPPEVDVIAVCGMGGWGEFVVSLPPFVEPEEQIRTCLDQEWTAPLRAAGLECETRLVHARQVPALVQVARTEHPDLLVIGESRYGAIPDVVWGPGKSRLLHHPPCPVVVVPADRPAGDGRDRERALEPPPRTAPGRGGQSGRTGAYLSALTPLPVVPSPPPRRRTG